MLKSLYDNAELVVAILVVRAIFNAIVCGTTARKHNGVFLEYFVLGLFFGSAALQLANTASLTIQERRNLLRYCLNPFSTYGSAIVLVNYVVFATLFLFLTYPNISYVILIGPSIPIAFWGAIIDKRRGKWRRDIFDGPRILSCIVLITITTAAGVLKNELVMSMLSISSVFLTWDLAIAHRRERLSLSKFPQGCPDIKTEK